jgi:hypothetical protein
MSSAVSWCSVHEHVAPLLEAAGSWPMVGTPEWCDLDDDDPRKLAALLDAARHWALRLETCQQARAEASRDISAAADWPAIADHIRRRRASLHSPRGRMMPDFPYSTDYPDAPWIDRDGQPIVGSGAALLDELRATFTRYVAFPDHHASAAVTLWTAATHALPAFECAPRLVLTSPQKRCAKSRTLDIIAGCCHKALPTVDATVAAIFRSLGGEHPPTLIIDEADAIFGNKKAAEQNEDLRKLLNAGHQRGRPALRCVGPLQIPTEFPVFAMATLAGIGTMPDTITDRGVNITMRRRASGEKVAQFRSRRDGPILKQTGASNMGVDDKALRDEGLDPDDPAVIAAIDLVRWEPSMLIRPRTPHRQQLLTKAIGLRVGSIPVPRTSITAGESMFLKRRAGVVHSTSTTAHGGICPSAPRGDMRRFAERLT